MVTHRCEKFWFSYDVMINARAIVHLSVPCTAARVCLAGSSMKNKRKFCRQENTKSFYVFIEFVDKRGRKRKRESMGRISKVHRAESRQTSKCKWPFLY